MPSPYKKRPLAHLLPRVFMCGVYYLHLFNLASFTGASLKVLIILINITPALQVVKGIFQKRGA